MIHQFSLWIYKEENFIYVHKKNVSKGVHFGIASNCKKLEKDQNIIE
jgi:hypothetical protein